MSQASQAVALIDVRDERRRMRRSCSQLWIEFAMFEGIVENFLLSYIGSYVKNIQKEQLKVQWNGRVLLKNVELNLEAFDKLQLPFSLKEGRVGILSIKVGHPIIISLENVLICACERDDHEWSSDSVERREYAGKKAKLHAAEVAKFTRRVSESKTGQSFISYMTAKILDSIQVSIENVHLIYTNKQSDSAQFVFGLRSFSLKNSIGPSSGKLRGAQVNKVVNISGLGIYCRTSIGAIDNVIDPQFICDGRSDSNKFDNVMVPCDVAVSLVVNRAGQLEDGVPHSINLEITNLVLQLNEIQLQHILFICDYLGTWPLREKYGRFRPCASTLCMKSEGWQKKWWQYAQKSVLSDIRKRLKKTSWSSLGSRILDRRMYVSFYKKKLNFIRQGQPVDQDIISELERMENESDIDDILTYRSIAERESQEWENCCNVVVGKHQNAEGTSAGARGWINWLSLGMLGAGGTEDSMQFSGVVSDEIVKDIYEVTQFHPMSSPEGVGLTKNGLFLCAIKFNVHQISATLLSKTYDKETLQIILDEVNMVFKLWEESWNVYMLVKSMKIDDLCTKKVVLLTKGGSTEEDILMSGRPFIALEVDMSVVNHDPELSVKVVLEPFEVTYESEFLLNLQEFYAVLKSFQFQPERVLSSHNGFEDVNVRLLSKAEYILSNCKKIMWDVNLSTVIVSIPWRRESSEYIMVVGVDSLLYQSRKEAESCKSASLGQSTISSTPYNDIFLEFQRDDLYDHFNIALTSFEVKVKLPECCQPISILDKFNASLTLASCIIPDEPTLKQLEVHSSVSRLCVHFSHSIYGALMGMYSCLDIPIVKSEVVIEQPRTLPAFNFRVSAHLKSVSFHLDIPDEAEKSLVVIFALEDIDSLWDYEDVNGCWFCVKTLKISTSTGENGIHTLCSSRNLCSTYATHQSDTGVGIDFSSDRCGEINGSSDGCFILLYYPQAVGYQKYGIYLTDLDLHIYPNIVGLLCKFFDQLSGNGTILSAQSCKKSVVSHTEIKHTLKKSSLAHQKFGFSNIYEDGSTASEGIPLDHFPFVTMPYLRTHGSLDLSVIHAIPEWSKHFIVRDRKCARNPVLSNRKRFGMCSPPNMKHLPHIDLFPATERSYDGDLCVIDLNLNGIKLYFHDTSCTLGTITLPLCKSSLIVQGTRYLDMLFSIDGLLLCSPWATQDFGEFLWGRSLKNISPILNIRVRKNNDGTENQSLEISFGVQHVRCVLPSEFLSILIGYFSLPDWSPYGYEKVGAEILAEKDNEKCGIIWKVEILDSTLILPVESNKGRSLHLGLQQLYFSFTTMNQKDDAMKDIPICCIIPTENFGHSNHILNIFGQGLSLSLARLNDEEKISAKLDQDSDLANTSLLLPLDIDLWIRIPCDSNPFGVASSTCIMTNINSCHVVAEDDVFLLGLEALLNVIDEFSTVGRDSEGFKSDVLHFLHFKKVLKEGNFISPDTSSATFIEVRCSVNSLSMKLYRSGRMGSIPPELVARADMQFQLSASLRNEMFMCLDATFSSLALHSFRSSAILLQCTSDASLSSGLVIHLSKSNSGADELVVDLPAVHIWLHLSDWCDIGELLLSYSEQPARSSSMSVSSYISSVPVEFATNEMIPVFENDQGTPMLSTSTVCTNVENSLDLIVRSENIGVSLHYPLLLNFEALMEDEINQEILKNSPSEKLDEGTMLGRSQPQYVSVILHSKDCELAISGGHAKLNCIVDDAKGMLDIVKDQRVLSWSIFQIFQVTVVVVCNKLPQQHVSAEIQVDSLKISVSHQLFYVWNSLRYKNPETGSSPYSFTSMDLKMKLRKASLLLSDGTCSCNGPMLEILPRNLVLHFNTTRSSMEASLASDLLVNYFNIQKVMWEPFIETWNFLLNMTRTLKHSSPLNNSFITDIHLTSTTQLNMNLTELSIEVIIRLKELITKVWGQVGLNDLLGTQRLCCSQTSDSVYTRRFAPYILQNETSLPLLFQVYRELFTEDNMEVLSEKERNIVYPGSSILIYTDETPEEHDFRFRPPQSTDGLNEKKSCGVAHHMISIQLDGTSGPSSPISMDIVGLSYFEVSFSKALGKEAVEKNENAANCKRNIDDRSKVYPNSEFVVPVVFDVSTLHYRKLIRVYSTVILLNTTSKPVELRFDTPFGVCPKVLGQIYPGQKFPLPLHLAESGRMSWCPLETGFLWSEAQVFSNVLSHETKLGSFRSFVCYPSHPSNDPFRCCLSVQHINLPSSCRSKNGSSVPVNESRRHSVANGVQSVSALQSIKTPTIHYVTLATPLVVKNNMPKEVSLTIDSGGFARTVFISEVNYACIYHIDSTHDLGLVFHVHGFRPITSMFPRAEAFVAVARFHENKFSQSETLTFYPDASNGPIYVTVEKTMDAFCGAREICIFVPFLLYNCTGLRITVADVGHEREGCTMPPCYNLIEMDQHLGKHSPILFSSTQDSYATPPFIDSILDVSSKKNTILSSESAIHQIGSSSKFINSDSSTCLLHQSVDHNLVFHGASSNNVKRQYFEKGRYETDLVDIESRKVTACMYFPHSSSSASELMVRLSICMPKYFTDTKKSSVWSSPFYLVPASGSTCVIVPQANTSGAFIVSVTSNPLAGPFSGRTRAITFQPRYVISNACSKDLSYKQKGTDSVSHLGIGQHSHLHWDDPTRELLVSLVFNEPGWLWSGSFFPDHLGDTQVKMRNYVCGTLTTIRVEVQNVDVTIRDEKIVGNPKGNSGTLLILLSDDETGFMPYRIDNFSKERLRIYQEKCKTFETTVHSYMSCPYTWDEPCYPRRLVVEVLGELVLGSYTLDDVTTVQIPIYLPSTSEKPGRQLFLSIHADGAVKVLSIMDSSYFPKDMKDLGFLNTCGKRRFDQREEMFADFCERISIHVPFIGVSLINSLPQELVFASANDARIDLLQSVDQQKISFQISSLQVDNQLHNTPYPVILCVDHDYGGNSASQMKNKGDNTKMKNESVLHITSDKSRQPMLFLSAVKWRNKDISLAFFEYIILRLAAFRVELEEEVILSLFDFGRSVTSKTQSRALPCLVSTLNPLANDTGSVNEFSVHPPQFDSLDVNRGQLYPMSVSKYLENCRSSPSLPSVVPFEQCWQQLYFLANRQNKIYVEVLDLAPIKLTLSFSSAPWMVRSEDPTSAEYLHPISGTAFQRGLVALADVEGAPVYLKQLTIVHHMGTSESFNEILVRHYTPQLLHEMYKIFGSASVIGNPMGFAKNLGLGIKDFLSVPTTGSLKSPSGLFTDMAQGTTSLFYSTVYAISNAATQFSKSVHKGIVAFTFDDQAVSAMEKQWTTLASHSKGVLNEFLEGLTEFLQSPIRGAEKHGLPGFLSGAALGTAGLVARPVVSILEVTGKTAQSIRNRSRLHRGNRFRARFPRPLSRKLPLQPYSWEEAIGISILLEAGDDKLKDEIYVTCRTLKQTGKFLVITERLVLVVLCPSLVGFGTPEFRGVADPQWVIEVEIKVNNIIYVGREKGQVNIVGINSETPFKQHQHKIGIRRTKWTSQSTPLHLIQMTSIELPKEEEAENVVQALLSTIERRREQDFRVRILHRCNLR